MFKLKETQTTLGPRCLEKQNPVLREKEQKGSKGLKEEKCEKTSQHTQGAEGLSKSRPQRRKGMNYKGTP